MSRADDLVQDTLVRHCAISIALSSEISEEQRQVILLIGSVITKPTEMLPALFVTFRIEADNDVTMLHAEAAERY